MSAQTAPTAPEPTVTASAAGTPHSSRARRGVALLAMSLVLVLLAAACGGTTQESSGEAQGDGTDDAPTAAADTTSLRVSYVPATTVLPLHVAEAQGYFEDNGLDVTLTEAANISDIPATLGRQFDLALATATDLIRAGAAGIDVVQVAGNTIDTEDNPFVQLIVPADAGIDDVTDLEGRRVGTPTLSGVIHAAVLYWAQQEGADPATITGVEAPSPTLPDQLRAGQIDAVQALQPFAGQLVAGGNVSLGDPFAAIGLPLATNFWMANGEWAEANGSAIAGFVDALERAVTYIEENPTEARSVLQDYTGMPPAVAETVPLPTYSYEIRAQDLQTWIEVLQDIGEFDGDVDPSDLVVDSDS